MRTDWGMPRSKRLRGGRAWATTPHTSWQERATPIQIGDTVRFSRRALRSIFTTERIHQSPEGVVTAIEERDGQRYATVQWDEPGIPGEVNALNLRKAKERGIGERG